MKQTPEEFIRRLQAYQMYKAASVLTKYADDPFAISGGTNMGTHATGALGSVHYMPTLGKDPISRLQDAGRNWAYNSPQDSPLRDAYRSAGRGEYGHALAVATPQPVKDVLHTAAVTTDDAAQRVPKAVVGAGNALGGAVGYVGGKAVQGVTYPFSGPDGAAYNATKGFADSMGRSAVAGGQNLVGAVNPMESGNADHVTAAHQADMRGAPQALQSVARGADWVGGQAGSDALTGRIGSGLAGLGRGVTAKVVNHYGNVATGLGAADSACTALEKGGEHTAADLWKCAAALLQPVKKK